MVVVVLPFSWSKIHR